MKYTIIPLLALVASVTALAQPLKDVIVSYPSDTPDSVVEQGMQAVINGGGTITHEYKLFKQVRPNYQLYMLLTFLLEGLQLRARLKHSRPFKRWTTNTLLLLKRTRLFIQTPKYHLNYITAFGGQPWRWV